MTTANVLLCIDLVALWLVSLRILGWGQPAPVVTTGPRWLYVTEFVGAPLWAALVLLGDVTYWLDYGEWPR